MVKIPMESLDFEDIWERWMSVKDRRFQEWFRLWISYIFLLLLSCCPRDYHWYQYVEMSLPFQYTQTSMFHYWNTSIFSPCVFFGLTYIIVFNIVKMINMIMCTFNKNFTTYMKGNFWGNPSFWKGKF
jgi:hypothetical protein